MTAEPLRFIHAARLRLGEPLGGLADAPKAWRDLLIDANFHSAERVFDAALSHCVDFLLLVGDLLDLQQIHPRGAAFLLDHFQRLGQQGICVYWAGGSLDPPDRWPAGVKLPENVSVFSADQPEKFTHLRGDRPVAVVVGASAKQGKSPDFSDGLYRRLAEGVEVPLLGVVYGDVSEKTLAGLPFDYLACGGKTSSQTLQSKKIVAHDPGSPQSEGTTADGEHGPGGCALVEIGAKKKVKLTTLPTESVRVRREKIRLETDAALKTLRQRLIRRAKEIITAEDRPVVVHWEIETHGRWGWSLGHGQAARQLLDELRKQFGQQGTSLWSASIQAAPGSEFPQTWEQEDTILGDFLREFREYISGNRSLLDLESSIEPAAASGPKEQAAQWLAQQLEQVDERRRRERLCQAAMWGAQLLCGDQEAA